MEEEEGEEEEGVFFFFFFVVRNFITASLTFSVEVAAIISSISLGKKINNVQKGSTDERRVIQDKTNNAYKVSRRKVNLKGNRNGVERIW